MALLGREGTVWGVCILIARRPPGRRACFCCSLSCQAVADVADVAAELRVPLVFAVSRLMDVRWERRDRSADMARL